VRAAIAEPPQPVADSFKSVPRPDVNGRFGAYGGKYVPETLIASLLELEREYGTLKGDAAFQVRKRRLPAGSALPGGKSWHRCSAQLTPPRSPVAQAELALALKDYVGRETPLYLAGARARARSATLPARLLTR
jgi:tryptophan synthase beta subunit